MSNIDSTRNFQLMAECMLGEALFTTLASPTYDTFPTSRYPSTARFQGADDFAWTTWPNTDYMIRWKCLSVSDFEPWTAGAYRVGMKCEIVGAVRGKKTPGLSASAAGHQVATADLGRARECIEKQDTDTRMTAGPFGIQNTTTIAGQGSAPLSCFESAVVGEGTVTQDLASGSDNNLGPNAFQWTLPVTLFVIVT